MNNLYNLEYLREISGDDLFIRDMIGTFVAESPNYFYKLKFNFINRQYDAMKGVIHKFKNAATYIGNTRLLAELTHLENALSGEKDVMKIRGHIYQIDLLVNDIASKLKSDFKIK
jgi:HPt (histidine-containing phosphotransfer) domain-containing protein